MMDLSRVTGIVLEWLQYMRIPDNAPYESWEQAIDIFPAKPDEATLESGLRLRLCFRLFTRENQYLISILESLHPMSRGVYALTVHTNWHPGEEQLQRAVEETYIGSFDDQLRAHHTLWAQNITYSTLREGLDASACAMLSNELVWREKKVRETTPVEVQRHQVYFPEKKPSDTPTPE